MKKMTFDEQFALTSRTRTPEGFLRVRGICARTGVYQYLSSELDIDGPERMVNVYRSPDDVFAPESLATFIDKDVTNDHPEDLVDSGNYRDLSMGHVCNVEPDGDNLMFEAIIKNSDLINQIEAGKTQVSPGYVSEYFESPGVDPKDGTPYEYVQRGQEYNHMAVVRAARGGKIARIFDHKPKGAPMTQRKVFLDSKKSRSIVLDEDAAAVVEEAISALEDVADEAEKRADEASAKADDLQDALTEAKTQTSDAAIGARVKTTLDTIALAARVVKTFDAKGLVSPLEIKRAAMAQLKPTRDWAGKSDSYVLAAFDAAAEDADESDDDDGDKKKTTDTQTQLALDAANRTKKLTTDGTDAYAAFLRGGK